MPLPTIDEFLEDKDKAQISDAALARVAGIDVTTFGRWKRREISPSLDNWQRTVDALERIKTIRTNAARVAK